MYSLEGNVATCGNTVGRFVSEENGGYPEATHVTAEVEPKRKASAIKSALESPRIPC
jgi:hypothetical protein